MAVHGITYWYCGNHRERYLGFDDVTGEIVAHPTLGGPDQDDVYDTTEACELLDALLFSDSNWKVYVANTWPYATVVELADPPDPPDDPPLVCGLVFDLPAITSESAAGAADGQIITSATDPNNPGATVKYGLNTDFDYATQGVTSGTFTGLPNGTYTVYARNSATCVATQLALVPLAPAEPVRYRAWWHDYDSYGTLLGNPRYRLDIIDREFSGSITEVEAAGEPATPQWRGEAAEDPFTPIVPSELHVSLNSQTDQQFIDLFTYDERRFKAKLYEYTLSGPNLTWAGFLLPMLYSEAYNQKKNYDVSFVFTDQLGTLADYDFTDGSGNIYNRRISFGEAITEILRKTELALPLWESVNLLAPGMSTGTSASMIFQAYFDPDVYLNSDGTPQDCYTVLQSLVRNIGSRLYQSDGRWNLELVTQKLASSVLVRKYDQNRTLLGTSNESPRLPLRKWAMPSPRLTFAEGSGRMSIAENYGNVLVRYNLGLEEVNNMLKRGRFEAEDIENGQFKGWYVSPGTTGPTFGLETLTTPQNGATSALYVNFEGAPAGAHVDVTADLVNITWPGAAYRLKVSFDIYCRPLFTGTYVFLDFYLTLGGGNIILVPYDSDVRNVSPYNTGSPWIDTKYTRLWINDHLQWKTVSFEVLVPGTSINSLSTSGAMSFGLRVRGNPEYDIDTLTNLKAVETTLQTQTGRTNRQKYARVRVRDTDSGGQTVIRIYSYQVGAKAESSPDFIRPNDYAAAFGYWKLEDTYATPGANNWLQEMLITNCQVGYLPGQEAPVEEVNEELPVVPTVKTVYEQEVVHGDITSELDDNYAYIARGYLSLSSGTPIKGGWYRRGSTESRELHKLLADMYKGQFAVQRWKLAGTLEHIGCSPTLFNTFQEYRTGKIYLPMSLVRQLRQATVDVEMVEALEGTPVSDTDGAVPPAIEPPVTTNEHTTEFSTEFT